MPLAIRITLALEGKAPLHKIQATAGHADPRTTERYWRMKQNLDDNAVDYVWLEPVRSIPGRDPSAALAERGKSRVDLASRPGIPLEWVNATIAGKEPISPEIALQSAQLFDRSATFFQR